MKTVQQRAALARQATRSLGNTPLEARNAALLRAAAALRARQAELLAANAADVAAASDLPVASLSRLKLDAAKTEDMARGLEALAGLPDPLGKVDLRRELDEGLVLTRHSVPLGVLGVIFESRPDAAIQIGGLVIKSGNAALLKGGREAAQSLSVLIDILRVALSDGGLDPNAIQRLEDRAEVAELLGSNDVDLIIPRGSKELVRSIQAQTRIPVLGHADGVCHIYLDAAAEAHMALDIVADAKLQYPSACNAVETLLVHREAAALLPALAQELQRRGVELRGCQRTRAIVPMTPATDEDWSTEYGEPTLSVKVVDTLAEAVAHIGRYGSGHTEAILTEDPQAAEQFLREVDAAGVYHNASTRFADGYRYGFGAEVGISTGRIHARGPVGLEGLVTHKYLLRGQGQIVADYAGAQAKAFTHRDLP